MCSSDLQGIPFAAQPLQQVSLGEAIIEEGTTSSSSLEQEIDRFKFEEEETILISDVEERADEHSCVQTPAQVITFRDNYSKPTCGLGENHFAYPWFEKCHLTYLRYVPFVFRNPPLLKSGINKYFCSNFISLSSQNKK